MARLSNIVNTIRNVVSKPKPTPTPSVQYYSPIGPTQPNQTIKQTPISQALGLGQSAVTSSGGMTRATPDHQKPTGGGQSIPSSGGSSGGVSSQPTTPATPDHQKPTTPPKESSGTITPARDPTSREYLISAGTALKQGDYGPAFRNVYSGTIGTVTRPVSRIASSISEQADKTTEDIEKTGGGSLKLFGSRIFKPKGETDPAIGLKLMTGLTLSNVGRKIEGDIILKEQQEKESKDFLQRSDQLNKEADRINKESKVIEQKLNKLESQEVITQAEADKINREIDKYNEKVERYSYDSKQFNIELDRFGEKSPKLRTGAVSETIAGGVKGATRLPSNLLSLVSLGTKITEKDPITTIEKIDKLPTPQEVGKGIVTSFKQDPFAMTGEIASAVALTYGATKLVGGASAKYAGTKGVKITQSVGKSKAVKIGVDPTGKNLYRVDSKIITVAKKGGKVLETLDTRPTSLVVSAKTKSGAIQSAVRSQAVTIQQQTIQAGLGKGTTLKVTGKGSSAVGEVIINPTKSTKVFTTTGKFKGMDVANFKTVTTLKGGKTTLIKTGQKFDALQSGTVLDLGTKKVTLAGIPLKQKTYISRSITDLYKGKSIQPFTKNFGLTETKVLRLNKDLNLFKPSKPGITYSYKYGTGKPSFTRPTPLRPIQPSNIASQQSQQVINTVKLSPKTTARLSGDFASQVFATKEKATLTGKYATSMTRTQATITSIKSATKLSAVGVSTAVGLNTFVRLAQPQISKAGLVSGLKGTQTTANKFSFITPTKVGIINTQNLTGYSSSVFPTPLPATPTPTKPFVPFIPALKGFGFREPNPLSKLNKYYSKKAPIKKDYTASVGAVAIGLRKDVTEKEFAKLRKMQFTGGELREQLNIVNGKPKKAKKGILGLW